MIVLLWNYRDGRYAAKRVANVYRLVGVYVLDNCLEWQFDRTTLSDAPCMQLLPAKLEVVAHGKIDAQVVAV